MHEARSTSAAKARYYLQRLKALLLLGAAANSVGDDAARISRINASTELAPVRGPDERDTDS